MNRIKRVSAMLLVLCMIFALAACGSRKPTADDAEKYVKAVLDILCTGDYDHSVKLVDADELENVVSDAIDEVLDEMSDSIELTDEVKDSFRDVMLDMLAKSKYTVGDAVEVEGGFDVPVTIEPLDLEASIDAAGEKVAESIMTDPDIENLTENELINKVILAVIDELKVELDDPTYKEGTEVTVRFEELEDGVYGVNEAGGEELGKALFGMN
ncbi:MAG: hypothetical protein IJ112_06650 [Oscillospiraceae bacterium]|nr:hypothetical protein [Oscillospiraceae bacterium]